MGRHPGARVRAGTLAARGSAPVNAVAPFPGEGGNGVGGQVSGVQRDSGSVSS